MADYIYLLENRLTRAQQQALVQVRELARAKGLTVFLVGGAVRDLTSGSPVRDLDVAVQGNALKLKKDLEKTSAVLVGETESSQALYVQFPGSVRMEIGSTLTVTFPKPGKPVVKPATILEDLRRRDFTANAMALSLNEGSYGLLMDPLNGVADIENRELRLVSNYGFIEDPVRMIRAARYAARLGWQLEEKTLARYETGKAEGYISALSEFHRGYETEEIVHEEDPLRVLRRLESEGWMKVLAPSFSAAKANVAELEKLREAQMQLQMQGIHADPSAAQFPLLTAKMAAKEVAELKKSFPRPGFVAEIEGLEAEAKLFAAELGSKVAATPSGAWKVLTAARPEVVLWVAYSTRSAVLQAKFKSFTSEWPQARQKVPYTLMQEMRIVPDLPGYGELVEKLFFELMDGRLGTVEEMKAYLEPFSPPAPPPPVHLRRARAAKKESKVKAKKKVDVEAETQDAGLMEKVAAPVPLAAETKPGMPASPAVKAVPGVPRDAAAATPAPAKAATPAKKAAVPQKTVVPARKEAPAKAAAKKHSAKKAVPLKAVPLKAAAKKAPVRTAPVRTAPVRTAPVVKKSSALPGSTARKTVSAKKAVPAPSAAKRPAPAKKAAAKKAVVPPGKPAAKKSQAKKSVKAPAKTAKTPATKLVKASAKVAAKRKR